MFLEGLARCGEAAKIYEHHMTKKESMCVFLPRLDPDGGGGVGLPGRLLTRGGETGAGVVAKGRVGGVDLGGERVVE